MKGLKIELPDYVWVALKKRAAEEMVSLRHIIMTALRDKGIPINDADMIEDGRRFRIDIGQLRKWVFGFSPIRSTRLQAYRTKAPPMTNDPVLIAYAVQHGRAV